MDDVKLLTMPGSLRTGSLNRALLHAAGELAPPGVNVAHGDIRELPPFDEDLESLGGGVSAVEALRTKVASADALLFATPEYNQALPGVLKNAVDWLSRPAPERVLAGKPVAIVGVTSGPWGTRYAQQMLRHVLTATGCLVMPSPMLFVRDGGQLFQGEMLVDEATREQLGEVVRSLTAWTATTRPLAAFEGDRSGS